MSRAYGWNARMLLGFETIYGTPPNAGAFHVIPFVSSDLDSAQGLIESNVLGLGRDPTAPFQDVINVDWPAPYNGTSFRVSLWSWLMLSIKEG